MIRSTAESARPAIELTPIIDMVFLLLVFFLVATTFHQTEREMQIMLPEAQASGPISTVLREIVVNVDDAGNIIVSGQTLEPDALRAVVEKAVAENPEQKVTVRGDRRTTYAAIAQVLDICKGAGIEEPFLDTVPTGPS